MNALLKNRSLVAFALSLGVGFGCCWWLEHRLTVLHVRQKELAGQIAILGSKKAAPTATNFEWLRKKDEELRGKLAVFQEELERRDAVFIPIRRASSTGVLQGLEPDEWKKAFGAIRERLTQRAITAQVQIPRDYDFTFSMYRLSLPKESMTLPLGVQLLGIDRLGTALIDARVQAIKSMRRAAVLPDEESRAGNGREDWLAAKILSDAHDEYQIYPFSTEFTCRPEVLVEVINKLMASDLVFIIREIMIENEKQAVPSRSQVRGTSGYFSKLSEGDTTTGEQELQRLVLPVLGLELIQVKMQVDLLYLTMVKPKGMTKAEPEGRR